MSVFKKAAAFLTALSLVGTMAGCGYNTREALEVNGYSVPAGVYIYFANTAFNQAVTKLKEEHEDLDTEDMKAIQAQTLEGKDVRTWIEDKATEMVVDFVATEQKFDELGLTLSEEDNATLENMMDYYWTSNKELMEKNGVSEASFQKILTSSYKSDAVFEHYYGIGGELGVTEEDVSAYYAENNIRAQFVRFSLADSEGNTMKADEKAQVKSMVDNFKSRVEDALAAGGVDAVMKEMDAVQKEYTDSQNSEAEEAATESEAVTEAETEAATEAESEAATEAEESEAATEAESPTDPETPELPEEETVAFANESIISVVHEEDYDDPSSITYNPSEKVYKALAGIKEAEYGKPYFIEEEDAYYLAVRYDIKDRMTPEDLWTESTMNSANFAMHDKDFEDLLDTWTNTMEVKRNAAAYKRYDPFKFDFA